MRHHPTTHLIAAEGAAVPADMVPRITEPSQVWPQVTPVDGAATPLDGALTLERRHATARDDDHMSGTRFRDGRLVDFPGSGPPP